MFFIYFKSIIPKVVYIEHIDDPHERKIQLYVREMYKGFHDSESDVSKS